MKVLIFNSLYYPFVAGGAERSVQILAEGLKNSGIEPVVVTTSDKGYVDFINGIKVYYLKIKNIYGLHNLKNKSVYQKSIWHMLDMYNPFYYKELKKIFSEEKPDLVHTNNLAGFSVYVWTFTKRHKIPIVHTIRDHYLMCVRSTMFKKSQTCSIQCPECKIFSVLPKKYSQYVDGVVGVSKYILNKHLENGYFKNSRIREVIYNSVKKITLQHKDINSNEKSSKVIRLGFVGLISPYKGIEFVLEKFEKMNLSDVELHIYGKPHPPDYENYLKEKYKSLKVFFQGYKKNITDIYTNIDIAIIPSLLGESFPRILIESYLFGIPVLGSNKGGIPEHIVEGETGFIFNPDVEGDFEKKLKQMILFYKQKRFSKKRIQEYSNIFSIENLINKYRSIYERLL